MKLSLSTDFGSPQHWNRVVDFAKGQGISRLVFWGDYGNLGFQPPLLYPRYVGLLPQVDRPKVQRHQERLRQAAEKTVSAGMDFWYVFQVLEVPRRDDLRSVLPDLFNEQGEPDMGGEFVHQLLHDQLDELFALEPRISGIELWVMECASVKIAALKHQELSLGEICGRIVDAVYGCTSRSGRRLGVDLHTAGGDAATLGGLFQAAARHPDVILSGDNVIGDFSLHLPFNAHLKRAAQTNPITVHFDVNGEYWGRNFVPTSALSQYAAHIEEARRLGAAYCDARVSTGHDSRSPYANVLPSRRRFYPALEQINDGTPLPGDLEICCTDTLGGFNAEFLCRRAKDPQAQPQEVLREFLQREFGEEAGGLVPVFMRLEGTLGKVFFMDRNYFVAQSCRQQPRLVTFWALDAQLTSEPGAPFPPPEALQRWGVAAFAGWPTPIGHRTAGTEAMIQEKVQALAEAEGMLAEVRTLSQRLRPEDRQFLLKQFEDLVFFAQAYRFLLEAEAHYYLAKAGKKQGDLPDAARLEECLREMAGVASEWEARYPAGRYMLAQTLRDWLKIMRER